MNSLEQIQQAEQALLNAQLTSNADVLATILADDLVFVGPTGVLADKAADLHAHRSGTIRLTSSVAHEPIIKLLGNVAVVTVLVELNGLYENQPIAGTYWYTRVWTNQNGGWQVIAGQCTRVQA